MQPATFSTSGTNHSSGQAFLDDDSAVVTVEYLVPAERWDALTAEWEAWEEVG
jgi:hypothetical protein